MPELIRDLSRGDAPPVMTGAMSLEEATISLHAREPDPAHVRGLAAGWFGRAATKTI
jgi:hypothetical protein